MKAILYTRESIVFAILAGLTLASWLLGTHQGAVSSSIHAEGTIMLILGFIKVRMIINNFMEVRHAPTALKLCCNAWIVVVAVTLVAMYNDWLAFG